MNKQIVVVDDDVAILDIVQLILQDEGYQVQTSPTGAILQNMQSKLPDLILLDVLLKGEDGREICRRLKESELTKHIPVILFSAHLKAKETQQDTYADAFLEKPFHIQDLLDLVEKQLS